MRDAGCGMQDAGSGMQSLSGRRLVANPRIDGFPATNASTSFDGGTISLETDELPRMDADKRG